MRCCIIPIAAHRPTRLCRTGTIPSNFLTQRANSSVGLLLYHSGSGSVAQASSFLTLCATGEGLAA
jgi:hypothetical protein